MRRTLLHEPGTALVREDSVRLLRGAAHIGAVPQLTRTVTVGGDGGSRVGDVGLIRVCCRIASGVAGMGASEDGQKRSECGEMELPSGREHRVPPFPLA